MKVALVHGSLARIGGGEKVAIGFLEAMNNMGLVPRLFSGDEELDGGTIRKIFGKQVDFEHVKVGTVRLRSFMGLYRNTVPRLFTTKMSGFDLVVDTSGLNIAPIIKPRRMIRYVHNPIMHRLREVERKGAFWSAYRLPYEIISRRIPENCILLANSNFTSSRIKEEWGRDSSVLYPPVELKMPGDKVRQVVSVGRFSFEKRYEEVVRLAEAMPAMKFIICGALYDRAYYEKIATQVAGRENILLMPDVPDADLEILLAKSRFFLHAMRNEDFGIAIVEAMSCGCIPVVHRSGGPKEIVGDEALTFSEIKEVPSIISSVAGREDEISATMMRKASEFSYANFVSRAEQEMKKVLS